MRSECYNLGTHNGYSDYMTCQITRQLIERYQGRSGRKMYRKRLIRPLCFYDSNVSSEGALDNHTLYNSLHDDRVESVRCKKPDIDSQWA
jgi:hypothetical protein